MISSLKDSTLEALNGICFHDIDVLNMNFDFKKGSLTLEFMEFDEIVNEDKKLSLTFHGVYSFASDYPIEEFAFEVMGCNHGNCKKINDNKYEVNFIFELDKRNTQPVYSITIGFSSVDVMRSLSLKSIEFKNTHFISTWDKREWFLKNHLLVPTWL